MATTTATRFGISLKPHWWVELVYILGWALVGSKSVTGSGRAGSDAASRLSRCPCSDDGPRFS